MHSRDTHRSSALPGVLLGVFHIPVSDHRRLSDPPWGRSPNLSSARWCQHPHSSDVLVESQPVFYPNISLFGRIFPKVSTFDPPTTSLERRLSFDFLTVNLVSYTKQEAQLILTNPRYAFTGQPRSTNMVPFDMLGIVWYGIIPNSFLLVCCSNFVPKTSRFPDIWLQKCRDLEVTQCHRNQYRSICHLWFPINVSR